MGWAIANACSLNQHEKPLNHLIIELSKDNSLGEQAVYSFIQYLKTKNIGLNISLQKNEYKNSLITMKYYTSRGNKTIFEGNQLVQDNFDSLYNQLI